MSDPAVDHGETELRPLDVASAATAALDSADTEKPAGNGDSGRRGRRRRKWQRVADTRPMKHMDADIYSTKKTVAQGFMDVALLSANADQLRTLVRIGDSSSPLFIICVVFLSASLILQVIIAICLMLKGRYNINNPKQFRAAETVNNCSMVASVLLTVFNVLATSFMPEVPVAAAHGMVSVAVQAAAAPLPGIGGVGQ